MNIYAVRDNLERTIKGKELMLEKMCPNNPYTTEFMEDVERAVYKSTVEFLKINIGELKRILADINIVIIGVEADLVHAKQLAQQASDDSWILNPDRQGGAFTQDELDNTGWK